MDSYRYGYYQYKDIKTTSKYEIMRLCNDPEQVAWHYHDEYFSSFNWSKEPQESIDILYKKRCEQLRTSYDYIVLMYSGGSDSQNILDCFVNNNIHLDEICSHINYEGSNTIDNNLNYEILCQNGAKETAEKYIQQNNLKTIYRLYDVTQKTLKIYSQFDFDMHHNINNTGTPIAMTKPKASNILNTEVALWKDLYNSGKKICFIWGNHKPIVVCDSQHEWFFSFRDNMDHTSSVIQKTGYAVDEIFYQSPTVECVNIMIKQSHLIKTALSDVKFRNYLKLKEDFYVRNKMNMMNDVSVYINPKIHSSINTIVLAHDELANIIYPSSKPKIKVNNKSDNNFLNKKDEWFWDSNLEQQKIFLLTMKDYTKNINQSWLKKYDFEYHIIAKTLRLSSKKYYL
jgi:hypothetical protein